MNKAFVRETDALSDRCPRCGTAGQGVTRVTLDAQLTSERRQELGDSAFFCPAAHCDVVYFDAFERIVLASALPRPVYPKDPRAPICACFGVMAEEIEEDAERGDVARVRELLAKANSAESPCSRESPSGQNCSAEIQRRFLRCYRQR